MKTKIKFVFRLLFMACMLFMPMISYAQKIVSVEYFVDNDPGFGQAVSIPITPSVNINNLDFNLSTGMFSPGFHSLYIRARDSLGTWSLTNSIPFYIEKNFDLLPSLVSAEYFIDDDPGFYNATPLTLLHGAGFDSILNVISTTTLADGIHNLYIRVRDSSGRWSHTNTIVFYKVVIAALPASLKKMEYFVDNDPGFNQANPLPFTPSAINDSLTFNLNVSGLTPGFHLLYVRALDSLGYWSLTNIQPFYTEKSYDLIPKLVSAEYFIDNDPGFGNASPLTLSQGNGFDSIHAIIPVSALADGIHMMYIRVRDSLGGWSHTNLATFYKVNIQSNNPLVELEYFIDDDPGFGMANNLSLISGNEHDSLQALIDVSMFDKGFHTLYIRAYDSLGNWSLTNVQTFFKESDIDSLAAISRLEYFINDDPGFGSALGFNTNPAFTNDSLLYYIDLSCFNDGDTALLYTRSYSQTGLWSHTNIDTVIKLPLHLLQADSLNTCQGDSVKLSVSSAIGLSYNWFRDGVQIAGAHDSVYWAKLTGVYTVVVNNLQACTDTSALVDLIVFPIPSMPSVTSPVHYCEGDTPVPLSAVGQDLLWYNSPSGGSGDPNAPTPVTTNPDTVGFFVSQTINGCESSRNTIEVMVHEIPGTPIIVQQNDSLISNAASGNQWYNSTGILSGETQFFIIPPVSEDYYVIVTLNGCSSDPSNTIHYVIPGIEQLQKMEDYILAFPNPFAEYVTISVKTSGLYSFRLFNLKGALVKDFGEISVDEMIKLNLSDIAKGEFLLEVNSGQGVFYSKIIKN